jgi:hypothetical protein
VGGINGNTQAHQWGHDLGVGALIGLGVGLVTGGTVAIVQHLQWQDQQKKVSVAPVLSRREAGLAISGKW